MKNLLPSQPNLRHLLLIFIEYRLFFSGPSRNVFKYSSPAGMIILCDGLLATKNVMAALTVKTHKKIKKKNTTQMFLGVRIVQCRLCGWA